LKYIIKYIIRVEEQSMKSPSKSIKIQIRNLCGASYYNLSNCISVHMTSHVNDYIFIKLHSPLYSTIEQETRGHIGNIDNS